MIKSMKIKLSILITAILVFPMTSFASVDSSLVIGNSYTTSTDSQFDVVMSNYQSTNDLVSVLTITDSKVSDIKSAKFLDKSGWVTLTPYQSGSDVLAKFISDTGFDSAGNRVINLRINFNTGKNYIVGFSLENTNGQTVSSAGGPLTVNGAKVLGESTISFIFTRPLKAGMRGADVTALQNRLTTAGVYSGPITGYFGAQTREGVKRYQAAHGIQTNGVVGPQTLASLNQ